MSIFILAAVYFSNKNAENSDLAILKSNNKDTTPNSASKKMAVFERIVSITQLIILK